jgi:hypothetical protein
MRSTRISSKAVLIATTVALVASLFSLGVPKAEAGGPYGPDTCLWGFVWREANASDHVCVTSATRSQTWTDNALAASRRSPNGGSYGPDTCLQGFVWREAFAGDHVCVTPATRSQAAADNAAGPSRRALDTFTRRGTFSSANCVHGNTTLDLNPNGSFSFRGHLTNDCVIPYNFTVACVVKLLDGSGFSFSKTGSIGATIFSRANHDWNQTGASGQIANHWAKIGRSAATDGSTRCRLEYSLNVGAVIGALKDAAGIAGVIIAIV